MKYTLLLLLLVFSLHSNGQSTYVNPRLNLDSAQKKWDEYLYTSAYSKSLFVGESKPFYIISFHKENKVSAYLKAGSDTLVIQDTVIELYSNKIRYIKIGDKVYPLNHKQ